MTAHKALRALLLTFILIAGAFFPALVTSPVQATSSTGETTLYFTEALGSGENFSGFEFGFDTGYDLFIPLSQNTPANQNDSEYPPRLILKNTSKLRPHYSLNANEWITWFGSTWLLYFLMTDMNWSDINLSEDGGGMDLFGGLDFEVLIPHPYRIVEGYTYNGTDPLAIKGDLLYNLYFNSPVKQKKFRDQVDVSLYRWNTNSMLPIPKKVKNTTVQLTPGLFSDVYNQKITLKDVNFILEPGESLLFAVEIIPCNKTLPKLITKIIDIDKILSRAEKWANRWENRTRIQILQTIGTTIKELISLLDNSSINITSEDIAELVNVLRSTSLIYNSVNHPASVIFPAKISEDDIRTYYLHANSGMDETRPVAENQSGNIKLTKTSSLWVGPALERNKICKVDDAVANLYINHRDIIRIINILRGKITINATLYDDNTSIATSTKVLDRTKVLDILLKPTRPITITFSGIEREITYGHKLRLGVSLETGTKLGLREVKLFYDSISYPSALRVTYEETQNIKITNATSNPSDLKIIPGDSVTYTFNVTSKKADTLQISAIERGKTGDWEIIVPDAIDVEANSWKIINVTAKSTNYEKTAYENSINLSIIIEGHTGIDRYAVSAEVSTEAIHYDLQILGYSHNINISKGEERFFYFIIHNNNTGAIDDADSYTISASSRNNWDLTPQEEIRNLKIGTSTDADDAKVLIEVPMNANESTDVITITVTSQGNPDVSATINVTVNVIGEGVIGDIDDFFDSAAKTLGLTEIFGSDAKYVLILLLVVIILFLLIILALVLSIKPVRIICTERIKEIDATEKATYEVFLQNPSRKPQSYDIHVQQTAPSSKWTTSVEPQTITVDGRQSASIQIITAPTEDTAPTDWIQVTIHVKKTGKKKSVPITLLTTLKEGKTLLQLANVSHWPTIFNPGEKVITSCSLTNNGTISARNVKVFFYLNGKQKNKLDVTIPAGSIADIRIPWIAEKGKNQVRIRVKE